VLIRIADNLIYNTETDRCLRLGITTNNEAVLSGLPPSEHVSGKQALMAWERLTEIAATQKRVMESQANQAEREAKGERDAS